MAETEARLRLLPLLPTELHPRVVPHDVAAAMEAAHTANNEALAVSYTHLTLPTKA